MSFKSKKYIMLSEFATLKNDTAGEISLTLPDSFSVPAGQVVTFESFAEIGKRNSATRTIMQTSKAPGIWRPGKSFLAPVTASTADIPPFEFFAVIYVERVSNTRVRLCADISNFTGAWQTANYTNAAQTITAKIATFKSPFET